MRPAPAWAAIVKFAPISVSGSASIGTRLILVFMFILFALAAFFWHLEFSRLRGWFASKSKRIGNIDAKTVGEKYLPICDMQIQ